METAGQSTPLCSSLCWAAFLLRYGITALRVSSSLFLSPVATQSNKCHLLCRNFNTLQIDLQTNLLRIPFHKVIIGLQSLTYIT